MIFKHYLGNISYSIVLLAQIQNIQWLSIWGDMRRRALGAEVTVALHYIVH
jgi:hypothetical protein